MFITCFRASDNKRRIFWATTALCLFGAVTFSCRSSNTTDLNTCCGHLKVFFNMLRALLRGLQWLWGLWKNKNFPDINAHWYKQCHMKLLQSQQVNICADILSWKAVISSSAHTPVPGFSKHTHDVQACAYMDVCIILQPLQRSVIPRARSESPHGVCGMLQEKGTLSSALWELAPRDWWLLVI